MSTHTVESDAPVALPRYGCPALRATLTHYRECGVIPPVVGAS